MLCKGFGKRQKDCTFSKFETERCVYVRHSAYLGREGGREQMHRYTGVRNERSPYELRCSCGMLSSSLVSETRWRHGATLRGVSANVVALSDTRSTASFKFVQVRSTFPSGHVDVGAPGLLFRLPLALLDDARVLLYGMALAVGASSCLNDRHLPDHSGTCYIFVTGNLMRLGVGQCPPKLVLAQIFCFCCHHGPPPCAFSVFVVEFPDAFAPQEPDYLLTQLAR